MGIKATAQQIMKWQSYNGPGNRFFMMPEEEDHEMPPFRPAPAGVIDAPQFPPKVTYGPDGLIQPRPAFSIGGQWDGAGFNDPTAFLFVPPDTQGDVGPSNVVVVINNWMKVWDRNGNLGAMNVSLQTFFNSVRGGAFVGDSRVRFDRLSQRWIITTFTGDSSNNKILIAVSNGPTITGATVWTFFSFQHNLVTPTGDNGLFFDYPTLGVDSQALYIGGNVFNGNFTTSAFVVRKSSILGAGPIVVSAFRNLYNPNTGAGIYTPQGVDHDDPASTDGYIIGHGGFFGSMVLRKITNPGGTPVLGPEQSVSGMLATSNPVAVPALGSTKGLDGGDIRMLKAAIHTNAITGEKTLWTSGTIGVNSSGTTSSATRSATRWYEIQNFSTSPSLRQGGTVFDTAAASPRSYWMGAVAMNRQGHAVVGISASSALERASVAYTDRLSSDALGTTRTPIIATPGTAAYNISWDTGSTYRWGDYSNTVVDPTDGMTIWTFQEYVNATNNYQVRVVKLLAPGPATPSTVSPNNPSQGSTTTLTVTGTSSSGTGFFDAGVGFPNHITASFSGSGVTATAVRFISPTSIEIDCAITQAAAIGARNMTITNPDGQTVTMNNAITVTSGAPALSSVSLPAVIARGTTVQGTVTLTQPALAGGATVTLTSNNAKLTVPASVTVSAGSSTANFNATAGTVNVPTDVTVSATLGAVTKTVDTQIHAVEITAFSMNRTTIEGGTATTGTAKVTLAAAAPSGNIEVPISVSHGLISIPATIKVLKGKTTGQVSFSAPTAVSTPTAVTVSANWQGVTKSHVITVQPPRPVKILFSPQVFVGGSATAVTGTVTLSQPAPAGGVVVTIECASGLLILPSTVTVDAGETEVTFPMTHKTAPTQKIISVIAISGGARKPTKVTLNPPGIKAVDCSPRSLVGGTGTTLAGTVTLNAPAAVGGQDVVISLSSGELTVNPMVVHFNQNQTSRPITITAPASVQEITAVTITGTLNGSKTVVVTVTAPKLSSVSVSPTTVVGGSGTTVTFTVNLNAPAPAGGYVVNLASSNTTAATMPATVTVPAGATTANVTVTHLSVATTRNTSLSATVNGTTRAVTLQVAKA
jgi:hypothetical protein